MPDWDNTESRKRDEDAAWRDLIARFDEPAGPDEPAPWPEREDMPAPGRAAETYGAEGVTGAGEARVVRGAPGDRDAREAEGVSGASGEGNSREAEGLRGASGEGDSREAEGLRGASGEGNSREAEGLRGWPGDGGSVEADRIWRALEADGVLGATEPDVIQGARRVRRTPARWTSARGTPADDDDHFVPPAPPPLPRLDPLAKMAWAALFGGPGYLIIATALHWSVPGYAAFCAVAAFVTGFAILVLRMNEPGPGGPDDGDDGAVV